MATVFEQFVEYQAEQGVTVPTENEVCGRCRGNGRHVNPSVDGNGISAEEWDNEWDDDMREMYLSGGYDVTCGECGGKNVVKVLADSASATLKREWEEWRSDDADFRATVAMEQRMGA